MKPSVPFGACVLAVGMGGWITSLGSIVNPPVRPAGLEAQDTNASASLLGQFRSSISGSLYLRTDLYLHNGTEMRPLSDAEKKAGVHGVGGKDDGHDKLMNDDDIVTVIPSPKDDFRGVVGDIERAIAPYKDMTNHSHNHPEKVLPLFRLMTWLDPQFVPGWTMGAAILAREQQRTNQAISFLKEGLESNPNSVDIPSQIGYYFITRKKDLAEGTVWMEKARKIGYPNRKFLGEAETEALEQAYRWLGLCYRDLYKADEQIAVLKEGRSIFPNDPILARLLDPPPIVLNEAGRRLWNERVDQEVAEGAKPKEE